MKSNIFRQRFDEVTIEVEDSYQGTIDKLRGQMGVCSELDGENDPLLFTCSKKGKLRVDNYYYGPKNSSRFRSYYVDGKVLEENGKTVVKIYSVHSNFNSLSFFGTMAVGLIVAVLCVLLFFTDASGELLTDLCVILGGLFCFCLILFFVLGGEYGRTDLDQMKQEAIKRVEAIKRWGE